MSLLQAQSPAAPMEVDPDWPPLPPPGEFNQVTPAPRKGKARAAPKKSERPLATSSGPLADSPTDLAATSAAKPQLPLFPELPPPHADSCQLRHLEDVWLNMPMLRDPAEMWAMWIDQNPDHCPHGIVVMPDGRVSMHGIRGMQLIKRRNP